LGARVEKTRVSKGENPLSSLISLEKEENVLENLGEFEKKV
jgi:hypothetical protein